MGQLPAVTNQKRNILEVAFDSDLAILGDWFRNVLDCQNSKQVRAVKLSDWIA